MNITALFYLCCYITTISLQGTERIRKRITEKYNEGLLAHQNIFVNKETDDLILTAGKTIHLDLTAIKQYKQVENLHKVTHRPQQICMCCGTNSRVNSGSRTAVKINISWHTQSLTKVQRAVTADDIHYSYVNIRWVQPSVRKQESRENRHTQNPKHNSFSHAWHTQIQKLWKHCLNSVWHQCLTQITQSTT